MTRGLPEDPFIRQLVRQALGAQLNRRRMLQASAAGAGALTLAACAPAGGGSSSDTSVVWGNWDGYIDEDDDGNHPTLDAFTAATGISVNYRVEIDDNNTFYATIRDQLQLNADTGFDTFCLTDWMAGRLIRQGFVAEFDYANIPNFANLDPSLVDVPFDPGRKFSLPWQGGYAGLVYNKDVIPEGIQSVSDLWKPEFKGKVVLLSEMRDTIGVIMMSQGIDISSSSWGDAEFEAAIDVVAENLASGQIGSIKGNAYTDDLVTGDAVVGIVWSGDVEGILNADLIAAGQDPKFEFVIPDSGGTLWTDNFLIPNGAQHKANAEKLIDWYYDPEVAAEVAAWVNYVTPVVGAREAMAAVDPEMAENWMIFPTEEVLNTVQVFRTLEAEEEAKYQELFATLALG